jgi:hypothetical protein
MSFLAPGFLQQQGKNRTGGVVSGGLVGSPGPTYDDSHSQNSTATRDYGKCACTVCCLHYTVTPELPGAF